METGVWPGRGQALVQAFFATSGVSPDEDALFAAVPTHLPGGRPSLPALRRLARENGRLWIATEASLPRLWTALTHGIPCLFPEQAAILLSYDRAQGRLAFLGESGEPFFLAPGAVFRGRKTVPVHCLLDPAKPLPWRLGRAERVELGEYFESRGDLTHARRVYERVTDSHAFDDAAADAWSGRGRIAIRQGRLDAAAEALRNADAIRPDDPRTLNAIAYLLSHELGKPLEAREYAVRADALDPGNPAILETLGQIELATARFSAAAKYFERAWAMADLRELPPANRAEILDQLVRAYRGMHDQRLAGQVLSHRMRLHPDLPLPDDLADLRAGSEGAHAVPPEKETP
jgi:tetratricopeptide (TPR) repeat protein